MASNKKIGYYGGKNRCLSWNWMSLLRQKIAYIFFGLASLFKFLGKITRSDVTVICDPLTLPGWFVLDGCLIEMVEYKDHKIKGTEWHSYPMPDDWCKQMKEYGRNKK